MVRSRRPWRSHGAQARAFAEKAREVVGIGLSESMLRIARARSRFANLTFGRADATALPFDDGCFDVSCIWFALRETPPGIRERVLAEMARVTRRNGAVFVVDYGRRRGRLGDVLHRSVKLYEGAHYAESRPLRVFSGSCNEPASTCPPGPFSTAP